MKSRSVALASSNSAKLVELQALLAPLDMRLVPQAELGVEPAVETGSTFLENALLKARHAATESRRPAIADDSGLVVAGLSGSPGVHSARFAGSHASDADNNSKLIAQLEGLPENDPARKAFFVCVIAYLSYPLDPVPVLASAAWHGQIVDQPRGGNGFGYDPHFLVTGISRTSAELSSEEKNLRSHRGQAVRQFIESMRERKAEL